jgi:5-methylcytosine-specific restriction enzyme A
MRTYDPFKAKGDNKPSARYYDRFCRDPETRKFYSSKAWRKTRKAILADQPLCVECQARGFLNEARELHHTKPLSNPDNWEFRLDPEWLQPLCRSCHSKTRANEDV